MFANRHFSWKMDFFQYQTVVVVETCEIQLFIFLKKEAVIVEETF